MLPLNELPLKFIPLENLSQVLFRQMTSKVGGLWPTQYLYYKMCGVNGIHAHELRCQELEADILKNGLKKPLLVHGNTVVHGFARALALNSIKNKGLR